MKALLVYPDYADTFWSFKYALRFISRKSTSPPLGLLTVAAMLPNEWELKLVDMKVKRLRDKDLDWAEVVLISAMMVQKESSQDVIRRCNNAGVTVIAGGPLFTAYHEEFEGVDHFVLNDAEETLPEFLADFAEGRAKPVYTTSIYPPMDRSPVPRWDMVNLNKYAEVDIQYSRGCPYACEFCDIGVLFGKRIRAKQTAQVLAELDELHRLGWAGTVFFVDDNFIGNKSKLRKDLLPALFQWQADHNHPFDFTTEASIDLADDPELMTLMVASGFKEVFIGIETTNEEALLECNKLQNKKRDMLESVKILHSNGLMVKGGFILGFDSDNSTIFDKLTAFIEESAIVTAMVGLLNAPKGTKLYKRLEKENRILSNMSGNNTDSSMNFIPKMDLSQLQKGYQDVISRIYSPAEYYRRVRKFLQEYKPIKMKVRINWNELSAFFRSIFVLGVVGKERTHYWKLLFWTLRYKPRMIVYAVTFAIYGFHFRKVFGL
ncbi:DUF4070 domain-containing protein [bacterium]|nr:DUF4070 domain-containing protein [bacterium]